MWFTFIFFVLHSWYTNVPYASTDMVASTSKPNSAALQKVYRVATVISAFSAAIGLSEGCTVMIKLWVKRRRPNFYALCGFDSVTKKCMADVVHVRDVSIIWSDIVCFFYNTFFPYPSRSILFCTQCV